LRKFCNGDKEEVKFRRLINKL